MHLTPSQHSEYQENGYLAISGIFPVSELDEMNTELNRIVSQNLEKGNPVNAPTPGWLLQLGLLSEKTAAFCEDNRILDLIEDIVKPGIAIYSAKLVSKEPFESTICHWHQDNAYYNKTSQSETRMSVWIPLEESARDQGCLQVIPGSHKRGLQPFSHKEDGTCNLGIDTEIALDEREYLPANAGDIVLFSAFLQHASDGNTTEKRRRAFIVSYQEATVGKGNGEQYKVLRPA
jgi:phytanoyl-CoA hydroxylase